jgi:hypothetical protein
MKQQERALAVMRKQQMYEMQAKTFVTPAIRAFQLREFFRTDRRIKAELTDDIDQAHWRIGPSLALSPR